MDVKSVDPTAEEFCRIVASMIVETVRQSAPLVNLKIAKKPKRKNGARRK